MRYLVYIPIYLVVIILASCVYNYEPDISKYENILVVDGELTNLPGPYKVKLSRSLNYNSNGRPDNPVCDAQIKIIEDTGLEIPLYETDDGVYETIDIDFQGIVDNSYKLQIILDGETYESDFETIKNPIPIDSIYWQLTTRNNNLGIDILLDTHDINNNTHFYAWDYEETWKFQVPYAMLTEHPEREICYKDVNSTKFDLTSTANRNNDIVNGHSIKFITEETNRLFLRYTILVKQHSLSEPAYKYFKDINALNYNQGTLFDPIPGPLMGNVKNLSDDQRILGYFLVCGTSEKRIFIDRNDLPESYIPSSGNEDCRLYTFEYPSMSRPWTERLYRLYHPEVDSLMNKGYSILSENTYPESYIVLITLAKTPCYNCTANGTNTPPEFWIEREED
ncbi:DUF4249 domain-containing protein [Plebeiibacterium sediminum]|uniref:DUF4249 domain-containing protein n=1 Tax=Plebeiibacterium sediminum TaxID=2992112 RepID=A0AAE3SD64_9BACT|nr:DUF4249 domain-containing protein [Plebeiobacterium sediminum]MCW3784873.1 DUF4249 domain-containing protein [Plebeiobacterium sediminum]